MRQAAVAILLLLGLGGCATTAQPGAPSVPPATTTASSGCPSFLHVTQVDSGTRCVALGGSVDVALVGLPGQEWVTPQLSKVGVLRSVPTSGFGPSYTTFAGYTAMSAGSVDITSSRSACPPPSPGSAGCHAQLGWRITVTVR